MKQIRLPVHNTFSLSFKPEELSNRETVQMPNGRMGIKIGTTEINPSHPDLIQARENGSQVIWATINIELKMEDLITKYLFGIGIGYNERLDFFTNEIMASNNIIYSFKKRLSIKLIKSRKLLSKKKSSELENRLAKLMKYRNSFAHGNLSIDNKEGCRLEFYSDRKQIVNLNDTFWNDLESTYHVVN